MVTMRQTALFFCVAAGLLAGSAPARAAVDVQLSPTGQAWATSLGVDPSVISATLQRELDQLLQVSNAAGFVRSFGDAQSFTSKGLGVDYASEATRFEVGVSASAAVGMDRTYQPGNAQYGFPIQGVGFNTSLMAGLNLDFLGPPVMLFGNWMRTPNMEFGDMNGHLDNWGVHAQVRLFGPSRQWSVTKMLVRWGGIAITSGFDSSHMHLGLKKNIKATIPIATGTNVVVDADANTNATFNVDLTTRSIPLEVTTSLRLLTIVTLYGGVGFDWQLGGGSTMDLTAHGTISDMSGTQLGTANISASASADPSRGQFRGIAGVQLNLLWLRVFAQMTAANTNPVMASAAFGARLAF